MAGLLEWISEHLGPRTAEFYSHSGGDTLTQENINDLYRSTFGRYSRPHIPGSVILGEPGSENAEIVDVGTTYVNENTIMPTTRGLYIDEASSMDDYTTTATTSSSTPSTASYAPYEHATRRNAGRVAREIRPDRELMYNSTPARFRFVEWANQYAFSSDISRHAFEALNDSTRVGDIYNKTKESFEKKLKNIRPEDINTSISKIRAWYDNFHERSASEVKNSIGEYEFELSMLELVKKRLKGKDKKKAREWAKRHMPYDPVAIMSGKEAEKRIKRINEKKKELKNRGNFEDFICFIKKHPGIEKIGTFDADPFGLWLVTKDLLVDSNDVSSRELGSFLFRFSNYSENKKEKMNMRAINLKRVYGTLNHFCIKPENVCLGEYDRDVSVAVKNGNLEAVITVLLTYLVSPAAKNPYCNWKEWCKKNKKNPVKDIFDERGTLRDVIMTDFNKYYQDVVDPCVRKRFDNFSGSETIDVEENNSNVPEVPSGGHAINPNVINSADPDTDMVRLGALQRAANGLASSILEQAQPQTATEVAVGIANARQSAPSQSIEEILRYIEEFIVRVLEDYMRTPQGHLNNLNRDVRRIFERAVTHAFDRFSRVDLEYFSRDYAILSDGDESRLGGISDIVVRVTDGLIRNFISRDFRSIRLPRDGYSSPAWSQFIMSSDANTNLRDMLNHAFGRVPSPHSWPVGVSSSSS